MGSQGTLSELGCLGVGHELCILRGVGVVSTSHGRAQPSSATVFLGSPIILLQGVSVADSVVTCAVCLLGEDPYIFVGTSAPSIRRDRAGIERAVGSISSGNGGWC